MESPADEIERLARLRDSGDITDAEYELLKSQIVEPSDPPVAEVPEAVPQAPTRPADELYESFIDYSPHVNRLGPVNSVGGAALGGANLEIGYAPSDLARCVTPWTRPHMFKPDQTGNGMPVSIYAHSHHVEIWVMAFGGWGDINPAFAPRPQLGQGILIKVLVFPPHLAGLEELQEVQPSLAQTVENRIDDPKEGPRYWAGTPISIERRPRYLRVRLGNRGPDDLVCIGRQPALYSLQNAAARRKDSRIQSQGPSLTTVKETLERVLLAPKDLSAPNYVSQLFESEGKLPTAPAVPSVEWRREEEQREYERERREAEAGIEASRKELEAWREEERKRSKERLAELERRKAEQEEVAAELARRKAETEAERQAERQARLARLRAEPEVVRRELYERIEAAERPRRERERELRREEQERERQREERVQQREERLQQLEELQRRQQEAAREQAERQAAREEHEAQRLEEADERNELFQAAQTALVREVLSCAVEAAFVDQSQQGCEPHKEQLLAEVQRDFGPDSTWEEVYVCIENCDWSDPDNSFWHAVEEHADAFLEEIGTRFGSTVVWGSTDLDLLASGYGGHSGVPVSVAQIAKAIASHMPLADLADIACSESEQGTTE